MGGVDGGTRWGGNHGLQCSLVLKTRAKHHEFEINNQSYCNQLMKKNNSSYHSVRNHSIDFSP